MVTTEAVPEVAIANAVVNDAAPTPEPELTEAQQEQKTLINAAMFLKAAIPQFRNWLDKLTGVQAKRVLLAIMEYPLENENPEFTTAEAGRLFELSKYIIDRKFIIFISSMNESAKKIQEDAQKASEETKEVENG